MWSKRRNVRKLVCSSPLRIMRIEHFACSTNRTIFFYFLFTSAGLLALFFLMSRVYGQLYPKNARISIYYAFTHKKL